VSYLGWAIEGAYSPSADIPSLEQSEGYSPWTFGSLTPRTGLVYHLHEWLLSNVFICRKLYDNLKTNFGFGPVWPVNSTGHSKKKFLHGKFFICTVHVAPRTFTRKYCEVTYLYTVSSDR
jgi:hypothetical protein